MKLFLALKAILIVFLLGHSVYATEGMEPYVSGSPVEDATFQNTVCRGQIASDTCREALMAGGLFQIRSNASKSIMPRASYSSPKSATGMVVTGALEPIAKEAVVALNRVVAKRAQEEAVDWILTSMPENDKILLDSMMPEAMEVARSPGYGGIRQNLLVIRSAFNRDLDSIPFRTAVMDSILGRFGVKGKGKRWLEIYVTLEAARRRGISGTDLARLLDRMSDTTARTLTALVLSWQRNPSALKEILASPDQLQNVVENIKILSGPKTMDAEKITQFLVHLRDNERILHCSRDSLVKSFPVLIDLAEEGAIALGENADTVKSRAEIARKMTAIAQLFLEKDYPLAAREVVSLYLGKRPMSPRVSMFTGLLDALSSHDTLALAAALERTMSPVGGWREKFDGHTQGSITAYAGFGIQMNIEQPHKLAHGIKVPVGPEYAWKHGGVMLSVMDLGHMMNVEGGEVDWTWEEILTPGAFLRIQPCRTPLIVFGGAEWRSENWTVLAGLAIDVTLWRY